MLLISPSAAALAIGAGCGGSAPTDTDPGMLSILGLLTPKVEAACGVESLTQREWTDRVVMTSEHRHISISRLPETPAYSSSPGGFFEPEQYRRRDERVTIRLANAFLSPGSVTITDPCGIVVCQETYPGVDIDIDHETGVITMDAWLRGLYKVNYVSGFSPKPPAFPTPIDFDENSQVLECIPDWMRVIVVTMLVQWYRTVAIAPKTQKGISYGDVQMALQRALVSAINGKFYRPRMGVVWGDGRCA